LISPVQAADTSIKIDGRIRRPDEYQSQQPIQNYRLQLAIWDDASDLVVELPLWRRPFRHSNRCPREAAVWIVAVIDHVQDLDFRGLEPHRIELS
jgi:hypothetical protein